MFCLFIYTEVSSESLVQIGSTYVFLISSANNTSDLLFGPF